MRDKGNRLRVKVEGWDGTFQPIERYLSIDSLHAQSRQYLISDFGFRIDDAEEKQEGVWSTSSLADLNGCLLVGGGDSGKTIALGMFKKSLDSVGKKSRLLKIRDMNRSPSKIKSELNKVLKDKNAYIIIDGIDECPASIDLLVEVIGDSASNVKWYLSSRPMVELERFNDFVGKVPRMSILPFSKAEAKRLASKLTHKGSDFFNAVDSAGLLEFCTQPGGLIALSRIYLENKIKGLSAANILDGLAQDYCNPRQDGEIPEQIKTAPKTFESYTDVLGWMASCLVFTRHSEFWLHDVASCPDGTLPLRECISERYTYDALYSALTARAIEPMGVHRVRFSYSPLLGHFAATWLNRNISIENASSLLRVAAPRHEGLVLETQLWLSRLNNKYRPQGIELAPEYFIRSKAAIEDISFKKYYNLLEQRYGQLTYDERQSRILAFLAIFKKFPELNGIVSKKLKDKASTPNCLEFAGVVVRVCGLKSCIGNLVDLILDSSLPESLRSSLSYNLPWLKESLHEPAEFARLAEIENKEFNSFECSNIIGNVLDCLWPRYIHTDELIKRFQKPFREGHFGAYERFIEFSLPLSFNDKLDKCNVLPLLAWAKDYIADERPFGLLGRLARAIFTYSWRWIGDRDVTEKMVDCIAAYVKDKHHCQMPFLHKESGDDRYKWIVTPKKFAKETKKRLKLLDVIVADSRFSNDDLEMFGAWFEAFPLYFSSDFDPIYAMWREARTNNGLKASRLAVLLGQISMRIAGEVDKQDLNELSRVYPENQYFDDKWLAERREKDAEYQKRQQEEKNKQELEDARLAKGVVEKIRTVLANGDSTGVKYLEISYLLPSKDGRPQLPKIAVQDTENYKKITKEERKALTVAAGETVSNLPKEIINEGRQSSAIISAIALVWQENRAIFRQLSAERIGLLAKTMFATCGISDDVVLVREILAEFIKQHRNECFEAIKEVVAKDARSGLPIGYALRLWESNITQDEAEKLISDISGCGYDAMGVGQLLEKIASISDGKDVVRGYMQKYVPTPLKKDLGDNFWRMLIYAIRIFPDEYGKLLSELIKHHSRWTKKWILSVSRHTDETVIAGAILRNGLEESYQFIVWLERNFPEHKRPIHEAVYSPSAIDFVYDIKDMVINYVMNNCDAKTLVLLERLPKLFPSRQWDYLLIRCRSKVEDNATPDAISITELKEVPFVDKTEAAKGKNARKKRRVESRNKIKRVIRIGSDLRDSVLEAIRNYDKTFLRGWEFAAIADIWSEFRKGMVVKIPKKQTDENFTCPKIEEALSDHLARYLDNVMDEVSVTRESQSSPAIPTGKNGSRKSAYHDITIKHPPTRSMVVVEVKGNWNKELKGAGLIGQLQNKYLKRNLTAYGIFVCACFSSESWCEGDRRCKAVKGFKTVEEAQKSLDEQLSRAEQKTRMSVVAIDCGYHL